MSGGGCLFLRCVVRLGTEFSLLVVHPASGGERVVIHVCALRIALCACGEVAHAYTVTNKC